MSNSSAIRAGQAYVEISARDDKLKRGLAGSSAMLAGWGAAVSAAGSTAWSAGTEALTAFLNFGKGAEDADADLKGMAHRTGLSSGALHKLTLAAKESGVEMGVLEGAAGHLGEYVGAIGPGIAAVTLGLGLLLTPIGAVAGAVAVGVGLWARYSESGQAATHGVMAVLGQMLSFAKETFGGLVNAVSAGDWSLAGTIAILSLKVALLEGVNQIRNLVGGAFGDFLGELVGQLAQGDFLGAWHTMISGLSKLWADFSAGIVSLFVGAINMIIDAWQTATTTIANWMFKNAKEGGILGKIIMAGTGIDVQAEAKKSDELERKRQAALDANGVPASDRGKSATFDEAARASIAGQIGGKADAWRAAADAAFSGMQDQAAENAKKADADFKKKTAGGSDTFDAQLESAKKARADAIAAAAAEATGAPGVGKISVAGAFTAAVALGLGGSGGDLQERIAKATENTAKNTKQKRDPEFQP